MGPGVNDDDDDDDDDDNNNNNNNNNNLYSAIKYWDIDRQLCVLCSFHYVSDRICSQSSSVFPTSWKARTRARTIRSRARTVDDDCNSKMKRILRQIGRGTDVGNALKLPLTCVGAQRIGECRRHGEAFQHDVRPSQTTVDAAWTPMDGETADEPRTQEALAPHDGRSATAGRSRWQPVSREVLARVRRAEHVIGDDARRRRWTLRRGSTVADRRRGVVEQRRRWIDYRGWKHCRLGALTDAQYSLSATSLAISSDNDPSEQCHVSRAALRLVRAGCCAKCGPFTDLTSTYSQSPTNWGPQNCDPGAAAPLALP